MDARPCDILVVGAGPAGAAAARAAARQGASVLMVERRAAIGVPVQCAEYIPAPLLGQLNLGRRFVAQAVKGMKTHRPDGPVTVTRAPGYIVHREQFDQALVKAAQDAGAELMTSTRAVTGCDSGAVVLRQKNGRCHSIDPLIVIGADGPFSTVGRWVGAVNHELLPGAQLTLALLNPLDHAEVYFHPDYYAGYGWLFPKGRVANVGLGLKKKPGSTERIKKVLDKFVNGLKSENKIKGQPLAASAGWIPVGPVRRAVYGCVALVGDAAGHTHPITGAGIFSAVMGGRMAGKWAGRAVRHQDTGLLEQYDREWRDLMGDSLKRAYQRRRQMEARWENFGATIQKCWVAFREYYA